MPKGIPYIDTYKYTRSFELAVPLFDNCNMMCEFCFQNQDGHKQKIDKSQILRIVPDLVKYMIPILESGKFDKIDLKLWGGEVFYDALSDEIINAYKEFIDNLSEGLNHFPMTVVFLSNGVHTKRERISKMLNSLGQLKQSVKLSYDSVGRFRSDEQRKIFVDSIKYYRERNSFSGVSIVMSKPTMAAYINGDNFLEKLPKDVTINANYYIPNQNWKNYVPNWKDYFDFFRYALDKRLFNLDMLENAIKALIPELADSTVRMCNCNEAAQYNPFTKKCSQNCINDRILDLDFKEYFYGDIAAEITENNQYATRSYLMSQKNHCYTCEHFKDCPQLCSASILFSKYDASKCPLNELYKTVTKDDIKAYIDFRKIYRDKENFHVK